MENTAQTPICEPDPEPQRLSLAELVARAQNSSHTDPTWRTDYR